MLNSCALVFIYNSLTKFTSQWFGVRGRIFATALILGTFELGRAVTNWLFAVIDEPNDAERFKTILWYGTAAETLFYLILVALFFKNQPDECPS